MNATRETLDLALSQLERILEGQLRSIDNLATKTSVMLGFVLTTLGTVVGLGRDTFAPHGAAASASVACLLVASMLLVRSYRVTVFDNPPDPALLLALVGRPRRDVRRELLAALARGIERNQRALTRRFRWVNVAMIQALVGVVIYAVGVGFT